MKLKQTHALDRQTCIFRKKNRKRRSRDRGMGRGSSTARERREERAHLPASRGSRVKDTRSVLEKISYLAGFLMMSVKADVLGVKMRNRESSLASYVLLVVCVDAAVAQFVGQQPVSLFFLNIPTTPR